MIRRAEQPTARSSPVWTLVVSCVGVALIVAAMAALYTALPAIAVETNATQNELTWIVDGYTLMLACLVLPGGAIGDRFGRRRVLIVGSAVFALASSIPLFVDGPAWLIASRAFAGIGAAFVMPATLSILTAGFPDSRRGQAVGVWAGVAGSGGVIGMVGSGLLLTQWSWASVFVGLTVGGVVLLALAVTLPESRQDDGPGMDLPGTVCVVLAIGLTVFAIIEAPVRGWTSGWVLAVASAGLVSTVAFVVVEIRSRHPLLDVRLFARRGFSTGSLSITIQFLVTFGVLLILVQYLQLILAFTPLHSALAFAPMVVPMVSVSLVSPWIAARVGLRLTTASGLIAIAIGLAAMSQLGIDSSYLDVLWPLLALSAGLGMAAAPATEAIVFDTPPEKHGVAAAVNDATREIGAAIGIAVAGSILAASYGTRIADTLPQVPEQARAAVSQSLASALSVAEMAGPQGQPLADAARSAFLAGVERSALTLAALCLVGGLVLFVWSPGPRRKSPSSQSNEMEAPSNRSPALLSANSAVVATLEVEPDS